MSEDNKNIEETDTRKEEYNSYVQLFNSMSCMTVTEEKVKTYKSLAKDFNALGDFLDAREYAKQCEQLAKEVKAMLNEKKYAAAKTMIENAKTADELHIADKLLKELKDYKGVAELRTLYDNTHQKFLKKRKRGIYVMYAVIVCIIGLLIFSRTNIFKYQLGKGLYNMGMNKWAVTMFKDLDEYKDSEEYYQKTSYEYGKDIMSGENLEIDDYVTAKNAFLATDGYLDANQWVADIEQKRLANYKVGKKIKIGDIQWMIVDKTDHEALLVKVDAIEGMAYSTSSGNNTWEKSNVREYLNTTFLNETFTKEEQAYIVDTKVNGEDNSEYQTSGGNDTVDKIFILSSAEQLKYEKILNKHKTNSWLRNPGASAEQATFLNPKGQIMYYGYQVSSADFTTVPAFWYKLD